MCLLDSYTASLGSSPVRATPQRIRDLTLNGQGAYVLRKDKVRRTQIRNSGLRWRSQTMATKFFSCDGRGNRRRFACLLLVLLTVCSFLPVLHAQRAVASIQGTVRDSTGAVIR